MNLGSISQNGLQSKFYSVLMMLTSGEQSVGERESHLENNKKKKKKK
jgi:hypothetical protein